MSDEPRYTNQSGGISIDGSVSTQGDLVGRDKITSNDLSVHINAETINILTTSYASKDKPVSIAAKYEIAIECSDIIDFTCDVVVLKYAQAFYGADASVASTISQNSYQDIALLPDKFTLLPSRGKIAARQALFIGTSPIYDFGYKQIREFANHAMQILSRNMPSAKHIGMTMHGVGYGLDERECFFAQVAGLLDAIRNGSVPPFLKCITIVERNQSRAQRLKQLLQQFLPSDGVTRNGHVDSTPLQLRIDAAGSQSGIKPHIFVAMPFNEQMEDTYIFGIQGPANTSGYLCERVDLTTFTGDILDRIKSRIETASLIIADLTGANPNVYLEVGYAWGRNRPTLLIARQEDDLKFDVRGQRCIMYKNISDLAKKLQTDLIELLQ